MPGSPPLADGGDVKRHLITLLKLLISLAILWYAARSAMENNPDVFSRMFHRSKDWRALGLAAVLCFVAVCVTFVRWYFLVRALEIPFRLRDAFRLGFLGFMFNFVSLGSVGGDLFKAVFIAREQPGHRAEAVASVIVDRIIGLHALLIVACVAVLTADLPMQEEPVRIIYYASIFGCAAGWIGLGLVLLPGFSTGPIAELLAALPVVGRLADRLMGAVRMYRRRVHVLLGAIAMSVGSHCLFVLVVFFIALGLADRATATLGETFVIVPAGWVAASVPLPLGALGAFELVMDYLYVELTSGRVGEGEGLMIALAYRVVNIAIALVGVGFYLSGRRELSQVVHEAEQPSPAQNPTHTAMIGGDGGGS